MPQHMSLPNCVLRNTQFVSIQLLDFQEEFSVSVFQCLDIRGEVWVIHVDRGYGSIYDPGNGIHI